MIIVPQAAYNISGSAASATVTINDDDLTPPDPGLTLQFAEAAGRLQLSLLAPASGRYDLEASGDLLSWEQWSILTTDALGQARLSETAATPGRLFFRARSSP